MKVLVVVVMPRIPPKRRDGDGNVGPARVRVDAAHSAS